MLTPVLFGVKRFEEIIIHDFKWYQDNNIQLLCGEDKTIIEIDSAQKLVISRDGTEQKYDTLLIATGSKPYIVPIPGYDCAGVMGFRDIADVKSMIETAEHKQNAIVLGGGLLGLEAANGLKKRGMRVTVVNRSQHLLNKQLDEVAAKFLQQSLREKGLHFQLGCNIKRILSKNGHIHQVHLDNGQCLPADLLIMATGVIPNLELARNAGLQCERGILVNDYMQTSDANIYAVGECIQHHQALFGLVAPVYEQAKTCAQHLSRQSTPGFQSLLTATMLKVTGIDLFSIGDFMGDESSDIITLTDYKRGIYRKIVIEEKKIKGMILYGDTSDSLWYQELIKNTTDISAFRDRLLFGKAIATRTTA